MKRFLSHCLFSKVLIENEICKENNFSMKLKAEIQNRN